MGYKFQFPFRTLPEALFAAPADKCFVSMWKGEDNVESVTFGEFTRLALRQAGYLRSQDVGVGDTVILLMPQGIPLMAAFVGAMILGAVPSILAYPNFKIEPAKYSFGLSGVSANLKSRLIMVDQGFPEELLKHITVEGSARIARYRENNSPVSIPEIDRNVEPNRLAFIQHSAGTTGLQKGVALSHAAVLAHIANLAQEIRICPEDKIYSWLPLYHDMGLVACFMLPLVCHVPVVMQAPTDWVMQPATMLELIETHRCSLAWVPNFTLQHLARKVRPEDRTSFDLSSLRALINCSEPVRASSMDEFLDAFQNCQLNNNVLQSCYAMAETVFAVTHSDIAGAGPCRIWIDGNAFRNRECAIPVPSDTTGAICTVSSGRCLPDTQIRIVSPEGIELASGCVGEIVIRSATMLDGYYNRPDLTSVALRDGWYWSGDLGFVLEDELYVVGRKKDLIIVAGANIHPQDVEEIVSTHPSIYDGRVVAFGQYNANIGTEEIVVIAEVRDEGDLQKTHSIERELRTAITSELGIGIGTIYLKPLRWIVKSSAGKPARSTTREKLLSEQPELQFRGKIS